MKKEYFDEAVKPSVPWDEMSPDEEISRTEIMLLANKFNYITVTWECRCGNHLTYDLKIEEFDYATICGVCDEQSEWQDVHVSEMRLY